MLLSGAAESGVELALARAGADVESDGGVREAARADILRVAGGPGAVLAAADEGPARVGHGAVLAAV